jgi:quinol-cytochrome oxidoreductase complex cytochrome b subunit
LGPWQEAQNVASWWYVFGSAALVVLILQVVTGILPALCYVPSAAEAWYSLQTMNHDVALGWFIRALHGWGSNFMIAIVLIHMIQVFLFGAYKFPRELTWIVGVFFADDARHEKACRDGYSAFYTRAHSLFRNLAMARADGS